MINEDSWKGMDDVTSKYQNPDSCILTVSKVSIIEYTQVLKYTNTVVVLGHKSFSTVIMCLAGACE